MAWGHPWIPAGGRWLVGTQQRSGPVWPAGAGVGLKQACGALPGRDGLPGLCAGRSLRLPIQLHPRERQLAWTTLPELSRPGALPCPALSPSLAQTLLQSQALAAPGGQVPGVLVGREWMGPWPLTPPSKCLTSCQGMGITCLPHGAQMERQQLHLAGTDLLPHTMS